MKTWAQSDWLSLHLKKSVKSERIKKLFHLHNKEGRSINKDCLTFFFPFSEKISKTR